jgi:hypothetical protein
MARGSCQTRIELKNARRTAAKLQKESRHRQQQTRPRSNSTLERDTKLAHQLELWLDGFTLIRGDEIIDDDGYSRDANVVVVDFWTDICPVRRREYHPPPREEVNDDDDESDEDGRRSDTKKIENSSSLLIRRTNNGMYVRKKGKGKAHPNANHKKRSDSIDVNDVVVGRDKTLPVIREGLCANEFFFGCCAEASLHRPHKGRKGSRSDSIGGEDDHGGDVGHGCSLVHYKQLPKMKSSTAPITLSQALNEKLRPRFACDDVGGKEGGVMKGRPTPSLPPRIRDLILKSSFQASMPDANCIDMMYHTRLKMDIKSSKMDDYASLGNDDKDNGETLCNIDDDDDEQDEQCAEDNHDPNKGISKLHDKLRRILDEEGLSMSSIVYLSIYGVLIYDRYRGGLVVTKDQEQFLLYGSPIVDITTPEETCLQLEGAENVGSLRIHERLTHHILDEILSFSDVMCTAILPQVCRYWRDEIGTRSPQLWNMLLDRHGWSVTSERSSDNNGQSDETNESQLQVLRSREAFITHYAVVRDVKALTNAVKYIPGGANFGGNDTFQCESAIQSFKSTNGAPVFEAGEGKCIVKIWSGDEIASPRSIAAYPQDCTLRLFEVVRGPNIDGPNNIPTYIKCRQLVCLRAAPLSVSRKKDTCQVVSMDLDDEIVACLVEERLERKQSADLINPWITILSREDVVCAGNEGLLDAHCLQSHEVYPLIMDHFLTGSTDDDIALREMQEALYEYRNSEFQDLSNVLVSVRPKLIACGRCHFIFSAFVHINESDDNSLCGHRLFLFSSQTGTIVKSRHIYLGRNQEGPYLFGSRPFKKNTLGVWSTNILVSGPAMAIHFLSVEIHRNGKAEIIEKSMIENDDLAPWSTMKASLTSSTAVFSTESRGFGANLHIQYLSASYDGVEGTISGHESIRIGGSQVTVQNLVSIHEHYVAVVIKICSHDELENLEGHWFGPNEAILNVAIIHIPTRKEIYRCPFPLETISLDSLGDTLAMNVANLGFVITGGNARDIARMAAKEQLETPGKSSKAKKKRLVSIANGQTKHKPKQTPHSYSHR